MPRQTRQEHCYGTVNFCLLPSSLSFAGRARSWRRVASPPASCASYAADQDNKRRGAESIIVALPHRHHLVRLMSTAVMLVERAAFALFMVAPVLVLGAVAVLAVMTSTGAENPARAWARADLDVLCISLVASDLVEPISFGRSETIGCCPTRSTWAGKRVCFFQSSSWVVLLRRPRTGAALLEVVRRAAAGKPRSSAWRSWPELGVEGRRTGPTARHLRRKKEGAMLRSALRGRSASVRATLNVRSCGPRFCAFAHGAARR